MQVFLRWFLVGFGIALVAMGDPVFGKWLPLTKQSGVTPSAWILATNFWVDSGVWVDSQNWQD